MVGTIPAVGAKKATTPQNYCLNATKKCDNVPILKKDDLLPASTASEIARCVSTCGMHGIVCGVFGGRASDYGDGRRHTKNTAAVGNPVNLVNPLTRLTSIEDKNINYQTLSINSNNS